MSNFIDTPQLLSLFKKAAAILWDFDGVIMDSMPIRTAGFRHTLRNYPQDAVDKLVDWHLLNGGLSRYVKFRRFQTEILKISLNEPLVQTWVEEFSRFNKERLLDASLLIEPSCELTANLYSAVPMHVVSGSDGNELRGICDALGLSSRFRSIEGSPTPKTDLVGEILSREGYNAEYCYLVGDSGNDRDAAAAHGIPFVGFGNPTLQSKGTALYWTAGDARLASS